jgi:hypothetical protein
LGVNAVFENQRKAAVWQWKHDGKVANEGSDPAAANAEEVKVVLQPRGFGSTRIVDNWCTKIRGGQCGITPLRAEIPNNGNEKGKKVKEWHVKNFFLSNKI